MQSQNVCVIVLLVIVYVVDIVDGVEVGDIVAVGSININLMFRNIEYDIQIKAPLYCLPY